MSGLTAPEWFTGRLSGWDDVTARPDVSPGEETEEPANELGGLLVSAVV